MIAAIAALVAIGSSPRGRGKRRRLNGRPANRGLIPAWAGKTPRAESLVPDTRAHPRVGGENRAFTNACSVVWGSSPRGRGKLRRGGLFLRRVRLIPAWAGKTDSSSVLMPPPPAHPRVGGENVIAAPSATLTSGSSPRGRGKRKTKPKPTPAPGLIPAWAGKTIKRYTKGVPGPAHPRVGGENTF